jgi:hypothetical protein
MAEITLEEYKQAYRKLTLKKEKQGFTAHAIAYAGVNSLLVVINLLTVPQVLWFLFPLFGWGIGLGFHYYGYKTYLGRLEKDEMIAERMAEKTKKEG